MSIQTATERPNAVTFRGQPMTLIGDALKVGMPAPEFVLTTTDLAPFTLDEAIDRGARTALLISVPSLDTRVCSAETIAFNGRMGEIPKGLAAFVISVDLPFAQARWANEHDVRGITMLSDYRRHDFGPAYGVLIKELDLLARAVFIVNKDRTIAYTQVVPEVADEPNYDEVFAAAAKLL